MSTQVTGEIANLKHAIDSNDLAGNRIPMMELLVAHGGDVNARWHGTYPIVFGPCETLDADALQWLLDHGASPDCGEFGTALDFVIATYLRAPEPLARCIDILLNAGVKTSCDMAVLSILRLRFDELERMLDQEPTLVNRRFPNFTLGETGTRRLSLAGGTLLHVAAEFGALKAAQILLKRGADVNGRATVNAAGVGGQSPIFHAASQFEDFGLEMVRLLFKSGAETELLARIPGHYEPPEEFVEATPLGYAKLFPGHDSKTIALLRSYS